MKKKIISILLLSFVTVLVTSLLVYSYPGGITGRTKKTSTTGCSCHTQNTAITGVITGPDTVGAGQTVNFTVTITRTGSNAKGGVDMSTRLGTLAPGPGGSFLRYASEELTQLPSNGLTLTNGSFTCQFSYTAPNSAGIDTIWLTEAIGHSNGWNWGSEKRIIVQGPLGVGNENSPFKYQLKQNYPNPFNPVTTINFEIPIQSSVKITVFDVNGVEAETILNKELPAGSHEIIWNASSFSSGVYFYKITANDFTYTKKMMLIK